MDEQNEAQQPQDNENNDKPAIVRKGTCQKGFFVLRRCDKPAIAKCALSKRHICEDCAIEYEGKTVSREAYAQEMKRLNRPRPQLKSLKQWDNNSHNDYALWYYYTREDFYTSNNYQPFNSFDNSAFGEGGEFGGGEFGGAGATGEWDDESGSGGFYDS